MANAQGGSPVSFVDANGMQYALPLAWITFGSNGASAAVWPGWSSVPPDLKTSITNWLGVLTTQGLISAAAPVPGAPAFTLSARDSGSTGNDIVMTVNAVNADGTADVTVAITQTYPNLTPDSIATVLGTPSIAGTQPGLAVVGTPLTTLPAVTAPTAFSAAATPPQFPVPSSEGVLLPTHNEAPEASDAGLITASITAVVAGTGDAPGTFTLTLAWTKNATGLAVSALGTNFGYVLTVTAPSGGFGAWPAPNTTIHFLGGTDASQIPATPATATVISA